MSAYLARLLLECAELFDGRLDVGLFGTCQSGPRPPGPSLLTLASFSESAICLSVSLEKSFSGLRAGSDMSTGEGRRVKKLAASRVGWRVVWIAEKVS